MERLVEMLSEPGFRCKYMAIACLGRLKDARALGALAAIHQRDPDGRYKRAAYEAMKAIRAGRTTEEGLATLRRQLEKLEGENKKLRTRLEKLEGRVEALSASAE